MRVNPMQGRVASWSGSRIRLRLSDRSPVGRILTPYRLTSTTNVARVLAPSRPFDNHERKLSLRRIRSDAIQLPPMQERETRRVPVHKICYHRVFAT